MPDGRYFENIRLWLPEPFSCAGIYAIPKIAPIKLSDIPSVDRWIPFGTSYPKKSIGIHMFLDDYRIERLWNTPTKYLDMLKSAGSVCAPDYSIYTDIPPALSIYNHYRKHWLAAWWQRNGITVIPTICWGGSDTFDWCFDGEPTGSVVAVSSVGTQKHTYTKAAFMYGYDAMMERLRPEAILFCGKVPIKAFGNIIPIANSYMYSKAL